VVRPVVRLIGYARVPLEAGERRRVTFAVPADVTAFVGRRGHRVVEPGDLELRLATSSARTVAALPVRLTGPERVVDHTRRLTVAVTFR
jgi:beta-xylosidase